MHNQFRKDKSFFITYDASYSHKSRCQTEQTHESKRDNNHAVSQLAVCYLFCFHAFVQSDICFRGSRTYCTWQRKAWPFETGCAVFFYLWYVKRSFVYSFNFFIPFKKEIENFEQEQDLLSDMHQNLMLRLQFMLRLN